MPGHLFTVDSYQIYMVTKSLAERGEITIPKSYMSVEGMDGNHYSKLGIGQSVIAVPLYVVADVFAGIMPEHNRNQIAEVLSRTRTRHGSELIAPQHLVLYEKAEPPSPVHAFVVLLFNPLVCPAVLVVFFIVLCRLRYDPRHAFIVTLLLGFSTLMWPQARDFFQHPLVTLLLLLSVCLLLTFRESTGLTTAFVLGLIGAGAALTRIFCFLWVPLFCALLLFYSRRNALGWGRSAQIQIAYLIPVFAALALLLFLNIHRFGDPLLSGYHTLYDQKGFRDTSLLTGLRFNLILSHRGLLFFAAPILIMPFCVRGFMRRAGWEIACLILSLFVLYLAVYSKWWSFHGGWTIGPRFLLPVIPLLVLPLAEIFEFKNPRKGYLLWLLGALSFAGMLIQLMYNSIEYTTIHQVYSMYFTLLQALDLVRQSGLLGLDYFFVGALGILDFPWYAALLIPPVVCVATGLWLSCRSFRAPLCVS